MICHSYNFRDKSFDANWCLIDQTRGGEPIFHCIFLLVKRHIHPHYPATPTTPTHDSPFLKRREREREPLVKKRKKKIAHILALVSPPTLWKQLLAALPFRFLRKRRRAVFSFGSRVRFVFFFLFSFRCVKRKCAQRVNRINMTLTRLILFNSVVRRFIHLLVDATTNSNWIVKSITLMMIRSSCH